MKQRPELFKTLKTSQKNQKNKALEDIVIYCLSRGLDLEAMLSLPIVSFQDVVKGIEKDRISLLILILQGLRTAVWGKDTDFKKFIEKLQDTVK